MKYVSMVARILLGLVFLVFGLNKFHPFMHQAMPTGMAGQYIGVLFMSHILLFVGVLEVVGGLLLLFNRYVALGLTLLGPVLVNIFLFDALLNPDPMGLSLGAILIVLYIIVMRQHKAAFEPLLRKNS